MVWGVIGLLVILELVTLFSLGRNYDRLARVVDEHDRHLEALNQINDIQAYHLDIIRRHPAFVNGVEHNSAIYGSQPIPRG
jgi:hypothetical protein